MNVQEQQTNGAHLTAAELRVLAYLPTYLTVEGIAEHLGRGRSTIKSHIAHVYEKLGVTTRAAAVDRAWELGLLAEVEQHTTPATAFTATEQHSAP